MFCSVATSSRQKSGFYKIFKVALTFDTLESRGIGSHGDHLNTGRGSFQAATSGGNTITVGSDVYMGNKSPLDNQGNPQTFTEKGNVYNRQTVDQQAINNGQTYIGITGSMPSTGAIAGQSQMYPQNGIHAL